MFAASLLSAAVPSLSASGAAVGSDASDAAASEDVVFADLLSDAPTAGQAEVTSFAGLPPQPAPAPPLPLVSPERIEVTAPTTNAVHAEASEGVLLAVQADAGAGSVDLGAFANDLNVMAASNAAEPATAAQTPAPAQKIASAAVTSEPVLDARAPAVVDKAVQTAAAQDANRPSVQAAVMQSAVATAQTASVLIAVRAVSLPSDPGLEVEDTTPSADEMVEVDGDTASATGADDAPARAEAPAAPIAPRVKAEVPISTGKGDAAIMAGPEGGDTASEAESDGAVPEPTAPRVASLAKDIALPVTVSTGAVTAPAGSPPANAGPADTTAPLASIAATHQAAPQTRISMETVAHLAAQIGQRTEGRVSRFEMSLAPEGLGRVDVSLDIDADGQLAARLAFDNPAAAADLRGRADELRRQLEDAGFRVAQDGLDFSERRSGEEGGSSRQRLAHAFAGAERINAQADAVAAPPVWKSLTAAAGGVDVRV